MEVKKIKDLYFFYPKSKIKAGQGLNKGLYPFYTSSSTQNKWLNNFAFNTRALVFGTGGRANIHFADGMFSVSTDCFVLSSKQQEVNIKYAYYYLNANIHLIQRGFKGAGLEHLSKEYLENVEIVYPDLETQNKIIALLDKVKSILDKRDETIQKYNELLQATFLDMFGMGNPLFEYWEEILIGKLGKDSQKSFRTGPFGSSLKHDRFKSDGEVAVLGIDNAVDNIFRWKKKRFLLVEEFEEFKRYQVFPRDVIITIMGTVGRSAVIPENIGLTINTKHLAAITLDESKCNPYYLAYSIHSNPYLQFQIKNKTRGAIMEGFNLALIKELKIKNAPIELQNKFEEIYIKYITDIEKHISSRDRLEELFNSLAQLAFKGELEFGGSIDLEVLLENNYEFFKKNRTDKSIQLLLDRMDKNELGENKFYDPEIYNKAKKFIFELLKEKKIEQVFDEKIKRITLKLK